MPSLPRVLRPLVVLICRHTSPSVDLLSPPDLPPLPAVIGQPACCFPVSVSVFWFIGLLDDDYFLLIGHWSYSFFNFCCCCGGGGASRVPARGSLRAPIPSLGLPSPSFPPPSLPPTSARLKRDPVPLCLQGSHRSHLGIPRFSLSPSWEKKLLGISLLPYGVCHHPLPIPLPPIPWDHIPSLTCRK
uniref:Uncharacterized protein n=1 Tax=Pipistrellus kuhlii TaxID=59472 RepID=A0A7J7SFZ0_PIPKU|nr:hypothetical protein mPipKuh1_009981 [Pipistrellus kuhlii]